MEAKSKQEDYQSKLARDMHSFHHGSGNGSMLMCWKQKVQSPPLEESPKHKGGNIIIDSGTTNTYLPSDVYTNIEKAVRNTINSNNTTKDPLGIFSLCYSSLKDSNIPSITFHFKGADVLLKPLNTFVKTSASSSCLAFISTTDLPIYGNVAQMNFLVGYDLVKETISFKDSDCTK
ncbi:hypothetical protein M9H77_11074 [Catharanthus roseus]|uniref:Uncharacterized protein n=1 Tax=Catharanthus roseus TaxID=4058 RepID=A0ACC0BDK3_CATRO|nr:hypothetical protein M9H77_11074 [Catharanthus roseus]